MLPSLAQCAEANGGLRDSIALRQVFERGGDRPTSLDLDLPRRVVGEFRKALSRTVSAMGTPLLRAVDGIRPVVTEEKMIRPNASAVVTSVANQDAIRDLTVGQLPAHAMSHQSRALSTLEGRISDHPIAMGTKPSGPDPTRLAEDQGTPFIHPLPEPLRIRKPKLANRTTSHSGNVTLRGKDGN